VTQHVAASDCERIHDGFIAQPANTLSSLAFVAAAVPLWKRGGAWRGVAAALAFEGLGSVAYHGPGGRVAKAIHDIGLVFLAAAFIPVIPVLRPRLRTIALGASATTLHALSRTGGPLCSCDSKLQGHAIFHVLAAATIVTLARSDARPQGRFTRPGG
jgi:hypothetical protein